MGGKKAIKLSMLFLFLTNVSIYAQTPNPVVQQMVNSITQKDAEAALQKLVDFKTRASTTDGCKQATDYVFEFFNNAGLDSVYRENYKAGYAPNIIGVKKGTRSDSVYIIGAHIDATSPSPQTAAPGADDNASGSVVVMMTAMAMSKYIFRHDIRFILFTGEEDGILGSGAYVTKHKLDKIRGVIINDMVGYTNDANEDYELECNQPNKWLGAFFPIYAKMYVGLPTRVTDLSTCGSDHQPFLKQGFNVVRGLTDLDGCQLNPYNHKITDVVGKGVNNTLFMTQVAKVNG
jgi:hypothetical protein